MLVALVAGLTAAQTPAAGSSALQPGPPDRVLLYGQGLWCVNVEAHSIASWLAADHQVADVCGVLDRGCGANTVFVLCDGRVDRLLANSGHPVSVFAEPGVVERPVQSGQVLQLEDCIDLGTIEVPAGTQTGQTRPAFGSYIPSMAFDDDEGSFAMASDLTRLDQLPDELFMNYPLWGAGLGNAVFVKLPAAPENVMSCWTRSGQALGNLDIARFGEGARLLDVAVPTHAPRMFALAANAAGELQLGLWEFDPQRHAGDWSVRDLKLHSNAHPLRAIATHDGAALFVGQADTIIWAQLDPLVTKPFWRGSQALASGLGQSVAGCAIEDLCLLWAPSNDHSVPHVPLAPAATGGRDETWLAVLLGRASASDAPAGKELLILALRDGSVVWMQDVPVGVTHIARLPMETCAG
ncbi:MAG TPA: hypothetical protein VFY71_00020 [Planctomycetota bacterium]|nr:hypothetical protein [Planctomycetota bacterium]